MSKTAVIFGGPAPEHDVSILTGLQAARELVNMGRDVVGLFWSKNAEWFLVPAELEGAAFLQGVPSGAESVQLVLGAGGGFVPQKKGLFGKGGSALDIDVAVNCCHGGPGEDGGLQGALDLAGIAYTGPNGVGAALGMDKFAFGAAVVAAGLPSLPRALLSDDLQSLDFEGPYIMKPRFGGSSIGIEIVDSLETAKALAKSSVHFRQGAVLEPYKPDSVDVNIGIRMFPSPQLSAIEKPIRGGAGARILGYADKYIGGQGMVSAPRELPAVIPDAIETQLREAALRVAEVCSVRGIQRLDFLLDGDTLYVNEINTIPGSLSKHLWVNPDVAFSTLLTDMIAEVTKRPSTFWSTSGADGAVLRSSGSIAAKLS
jgi:D-alanine-D-alanine ligase